MGLFTYVVVVVVVVVTAVLVEGKEDVVVGVAQGDDLDTPEWQQNIPQESKIAKYRKRRFISFPTGSFLAVRLNLTVPTEGLSDRGSIMVVNDLLFFLPNSSFTGRSQRPCQQRLDIFSRMESFLSRMGLDGHACTLRVICEVTELPFQHGLFGEVVNLLVKVTGESYNEVDGEEAPPDDDYLLAEYYGRRHGSCYAFYPTCPFSLTNLVSHIVPV